MAGIITDIKYQKRNQNQVSVYLDGKYAFSVPLLKASNYNTGQILNPSEVKQLQKENNQRLAYQSAIRYLSRSPKSAGEVTQYLNRKGVPGEIVAETILLLKEKKYINDEAYARLYIENRERFRPRSKFVLRFELKQKGIDPEIIDQSLESVDEDISAWKAIETKIYRWEGLPEDKFKLKIMGFLSRRGFNYEICQVTYEKALTILDTKDHN